LTEEWKQIVEIISSENENEISKLICYYLWDLEVSEFNNTYLGVIESAIVENKIFKNPILTSLFTSYFGIIDKEIQTIEGISKEYNITNERVRQLKELLENKLDNYFSFVKNDLFRYKFNAYLGLSKLSEVDFDQLALYLNSTYKVRFTREFYIYFYSRISDSVLIGKFSDLRNLNKRSSSRNIWNGLYLISEEQFSKCKIDQLINSLAVEVHKGNYHFEADIVFDIKKYLTEPLNHEEISLYSSMIKNEIEIPVELHSDYVVILRNSMITQPEMVEAALIELGGFAYADEILEKLNIKYPEKDWTLSMVRSSIRGENFYTVGKSGLFGLKDYKDISALVGDGTLNDVLTIYMENSQLPVHIFDILNHVNHLFPRPKSIESIHTILEQDSKDKFIKFTGGYYGLKSMVYENTLFSAIYGGQASYMKKLIFSNDGLSFDFIFQLFNKNYGLTEVQVNYLLFQLLSSGKIEKRDGIYYPNLSTINISENEVEKENSDFDAINDEFNDTDNVINEENSSSSIDHFYGDVYQQIKIRRGQPAFRQKLLEHFKSTCIITGCRISELLEASHIFPHSLGGDFSISNGLLLRADIHTLFDLDLLAINPNSFKLFIDRSLVNTEYAFLQDLNLQNKLKEVNSEITINNSALLFRWEKFLESNIVKY
jgi:hypothetical protein